MQASEQSKVDGSEQSSNNDQAVVNGE